MNAKKQLTSRVLVHSTLSSAPYSSLAARFHSSPNNPHLRKLSMKTSSNASTRLPPNSPASDPLSELVLGIDMPLQSELRRRKRRLCRVQAVFHVIHVFQPWVNIGIIGRI